jgi:hypothetical protein
MLRLSIVVPAEAGTQYTRASNLNRYRLRLLDGHLRGHDMECVPPYMLSFALVAARGG